MKKPRKKRIQTDIDVKRRATKLVVTHLSKKIPEGFMGTDLIYEWINKMEELLKKEEFELKEYIELRKNLNDIIERIVDEELRFKLRDSWFSLGKALDKKAKKD